MKPVNRGTSPQKFKSYEEAKPALLARLGEQCSYCGRSGDPQDMHVEHIYPKDPHPSRELLWSNFLLACNTCNSYKNVYLGSGKQSNLLKRFIWPHLDNTFVAFNYKKTGKIDIADSVPSSLKPVIERTREMVGLMLSPAKAVKYESVGIAYDGAKKRSQIWSQAEDFLEMYRSAPKRKHAATIADGAAKIGYFDVWMTVFRNYVVVRRELIRAFKADGGCFDPKTTLPVRKGRI